MGQLVGFPTTGDELSSHTDLYTHSCSWDRVERIGYPRLGARLSTVFSQSAAGWQLVTIISGGQGVSIDSVDCTDREESLQPEGVNGAPFGTPSGLLSGGRGHLTPKSTHIAHAENSYWCK